MQMPCFTDAVQVYRQRLAKEESAVLTHSDIARPEQYKRTWYSHAREKNKAMEFAERASTLAPNEHSARDTAGSWSRAVS